MEIILFFIIGATAIISALLMIFSKNAVHSALFLLLNLVMLAGLYVLLNAQFIAMVQIMVYAGAILVLILFVVMLLGAELGEDIPTWLNSKTVVAGFLALVLVTITGTAIFEWLQVSQPMQGDATNEAIAAFGNVESVALALFTEHLLAFELTSVLILVGIVGVVTIGKWKKIQHAEKDR